MLSASEQSLSFFGEISDVLIATNDQAHTN
jgi:hypothetical protein